MRPIHPRRLLLVSIALAMALYSPTSQAQKRGKRAFPPGIPEALVMQQEAKKLGLSEETLVALKAVIEEARPKEAEYRKQSGLERSKLYALLDQNLPKEKALLDASTAVEKVVKEAREFRLRCSLKARSLLTPKQLEKFMEIRKNIPIPKQRQGRRRR